MNVFERIANSKPINRTANDVVSSGEHFSFAKESNYSAHSDVPLPLSKRLVPANKENYTGLSFGRLTVIGLADVVFKISYDENGARREKLRWVVRCVCGYYEHRSSKALKQLSDKPEEEKMCSACKKMEFRKQGRGPWLKEGWTPPAETLALKLPPPIKKQIQLPKKKDIIPAKIRWLVWERDDFTCKHCGSRKHLAVDHIQAESKGGKTEIENLQTLCGTCNSKKGAS